MDINLERTAAAITSAKQPDDIFGLASSAALVKARSVYRQLVRVLHPDKYTDAADKALATESFKRLQDFYDIFIARCTGINSTSVKPSVAILKTKLNIYTLGSQIAVGDISSIYSCTNTNGEVAIIKIARDPRDNDLILNESRVLKKLQSADVKFPELQVLTPRLTETFICRDQKKVNKQAIALVSAEGFYSLAQVHQQYPTGVDPKDMAWMYRRLLLALGFAQENNIIHGAVLPEHVLIHPESHDLLLIDWSYSVAASDGHLTAISANYKSWYPQEVFKKEPATLALDIYMAAACMVYLLGGDPVKHTISTNVPRQIRAFLLSCLLAAPTMRPQDALALREEFTDVIENLWGRRVFHEFIMPLVN